MVFSYDPKSCTLGWPEIQILLISIEFLLISIIHGTYCGPLGIRSEPEISVSDTKMLYML